MAGWQSPDGDYNDLKYIQICYSVAMPKPIPTAFFHILVAVADGERHGYSIMKDVAARTEGQLQLSPGTLYGSIKRMLQDGLIKEVEKRPESGHDDERRRYYRITPQGRKVAMAEAARLATLLSQARASGLVPRRT
jgi:DNA-binding PadR family transcriptional regulator